MVGTLSGDSRALLEALNDGVAVLAPSGEVLLMNASMHRILGYTVDDTRDASQLLELLFGHDPEVHQRALLEFQQDLAQPHPPAREYPFRHGDGSHRWVEFRMSTVGNAAINSATDITERKRLHAQVEDQLRVLEAAKRDLEKSGEQLRHAATHDPLTGVPNRRLLLEALSKAVSAPEEAGSSALFFVDLDDLKAVNDALGHSTGDALLEEAARRVAKAVRPDDLVARLGGDEFAVLLGGLGAPQDALSVAERIVHAMEAPFHIDGRAVITTASVGVAIGVNTSTSTEEALHAADQAMYEAKGLGGSRYVVADLGTTSSRNP